MRTISLSVVLFFLAVTCFSQTTVKKIDTYIKNARTSWNVPGLAVAIVKDGKIVLEQGYGVAEEGKKKSVDANTLFAIASNTKAFISASLANIIDNGSLSWDDKVIDHLPYFRLYDEYATQNATIRDLLSHRLGLGTFSGDVIWYKSNLQAQEVVRKIQFVPQNYEFRSGYGYSNLMFITAGEVIKSATDKPWNQFLEENVFAPLDMTRTVTSVTSLDGMSNVATPHKPIEGKNTPIEYTNWDNMGAAGGIISSVHDMAQWMKLQLDQGIIENDTIFSPAAQVDMWTPHNNYRVDQSSKDFIPSRHFSGYGLGWGLSDYKGNMMVTHGGGYDGMYSKVTLIPDEKLGIVVLTNSMKGISTPITLWMIDAFLGKNDRDWSKEYLDITKKSDQFKIERVQKRIESRIKNSSPSLSLNKYTGRYHDSMYGTTEVITQNNQLAIRFETAPLLNASLTHWHFDTFKLEWENTHAWFDFGTIKFQMDNNNNVTGFKFDVPNDDIFFYELNMKKVD